MAYTQNTPEEIRQMLDVIGVSSIDDLFAPIPESLVLKKDLAIPPSLSEPEILRRMGDAAAQNVHLGEMPSFLGAGAYRHHIPTIVDHLAGRSEFATSYTPYQPEASQGTLQAIFEYQTLICQLTELDLSNASMYDGASALAEAILMAERVKKRGRVVLSDTVHPEYIEVVRTYLSNLEISV